MERHRERGRIPSRLCTVSPEPNTELNLTNLENMTWAKIKSWMLNSLSHLCPQLTLCSSKAQNHTFLQYFMGTDTYQVQNRHLLEINKLWSGFYPEWGISEYKGEKQMTCYLLFIYFLRVLTYLNGTLWHLEEVRFSTLFNIIFPCSDISSNIWTLFNLHHSFCNLSLFLLFYSSRT